VSRAASTIVMLLSLLLGACMTARPASPLAQPSRTPITVTPPPVSSPPPAPVLRTPTLSSELALQAVAGTIVAGEVPVLRDSCPSPDGKWLAEVFAYECMPVTVVEESFNAYEILRVTNTVSGEARIVDRQVQSCGGIGAAGLSGISWSRNSRFFSSLRQPGGRQRVAVGGCRPPADWMSSPGP
jgi:hypothetical protein